MNKNYRRMNYWRLHYLLIDAINVIVRYQSTGKWDMPDTTPLRLKRQAHEMFQELTQRDFGWRKRIKT